MQTNSFVFPIANILFMVSVLFACTKPEDTTNLIPMDSDMTIPETVPTNEKKTKYTYLALGDSYTVGQNVSASESFPAQLEKLLEINLAARITTDMVATTGWRTDDLLDGIENSSLQPPYDIVTLLIGVNNQYQGQPFTQYEEEFPKLLNRALQLAGNNGNVVVISIPDYGYTPFGENADRQQISKDIDRYNTFAETTVQSRNVAYVYITDITRNGLDQPELVADDGLHPSGEAYRMFAARIAPFIVSQLKD